MFITQCKKGCWGYSTSLLCYYYNLKMSIIRPLLCFPFYFIFLLFSCILSCFIFICHWITVFPLLTTFQLQEPIKTYLILILGLQVYFWGRPVWCASTVVSVFCHYYMQLFQLQQKHTYWINKMCKQISKYMKTGYLWICSFGNCTADLSTISF